MIDVQYGGTKLDLQQYLKDEFVGVSLFDDSFVGKEFAVRIKLEKKLYQLKDDSDEIMKKQLKFLMKFSKIMMSFIWLLIFEVN